MNTLKRVNEVVYGQKNLTKIIVGKKFKVSNERTKIGKENNATASFTLILKHQYIGIPSQKEQRNTEKKKLIINLSFARKNTKKVRNAAGVIKNSLPATSKSKAKSLMNVVNSRSDTYSTPNTPQVIDLTLYHTYERKRGRCSNYTKQLLMKDLTD